jgi:hypothetical protein
MFGFTKRLIQPKSIDSILSDVTKKVAELRDAEVRHAAAVAAQDKVIEAARETRRLNDLEATRARNIAARFNALVSDDNTAFKLG